MNKLLILKIVILVGALAMIISIMGKLSPEKVTDALATIGAAPGTPDSPGLQPWTREVKPGEERFNICRTRVHAVVWADGKKVEELKQGLKLTWRSFNPEPRELPYMGVEKWFSRHCQIVIQPVRDAAQTPAPGDFQPYLKLEFIDGEAQLIERTVDGIFRSGDAIFKSDDLEAAMAELSAIAQFP